MQGGVVVGHHDGAAGEGLENAVVDHSDATLGVDGGGKNHVGGGVGVRYVVSTVSKG